MKSLLKIVLAAIVATAAPGISLAGEYRVGDLVIENPLIRATPPNAPVSGGYMTIRNEGAEADRLVGASAGFSGKAEIHEMTMEGDVMKMRPLEGGLEIPSGGSVALMPGGFHVMFMQLGEQMKEGEVRKATLTFENAGSVEVEFAVKAPNAMPKPGHGG